MFALTCLRRSDSIVRFASRSCSRCCCTEDEDEEGVEADEVDGDDDIKVDGDDRSAESSFIWGSVSSDTCSRS